MKPTLLHYLILASLLIATPIHAQDISKFTQEVSFFYLHPSKEHYNTLQRQADKFAGALEGKGNRADLLVAEWIARVSQRYHWPITGGSSIANKAGDIANGQSQIANYVRNDRNVDPSKIDIWWMDFFATGDSAHLGKILRHAEKLRAGQKAGEMLVPFSASWSFKSNCRQHPAVLAYANDCLKTNKFPEKRDFLQDCVSYSEKK
jgi:hypothetical protein